MDNILQKCYSEPRICLKTHCPNLHASLRGIFVPNSVGVAHYAAFTWNKSSTKCDAHLGTSSFQTHPEMDCTVQLFSRR
ncbi:DUF6783 domain-containing protein [Faecalicatena contorta]|uniref:DUF6783 domain-containing protein n=1 Tax=Faecalicatena contorta TaxID=39482 RepID=UPI003B503370